MCSSFGRGGDQPHRRCPLALPYFRPCSPRCGWTARGGGFRPGAGNGQYWGCQLDVSDCYWGPGSPAHAVRTREGQGSTEPVPFLPCTQLQGMWDQLSIREGSGKLMLRVDPWRGENCCAGSQASPPSPHRGGEDTAGGEAPLLLARAVCGSAQQAAGGGPVGQAHWGSRAGSLPRRADRTTSLWSTTTLTTHWSRG